MAGEVVYRKAVPSDREGILAVSALFPDDWIPYGIDEALAAERGGFFVAEAAGRIVAICAAQVEGDRAWLEAMRVNPAYQGRGLATTLTAHVLEACGRWGCRKARLSTDRTNAPVHRFIGEKLGFSALGRWVVSEEETDLDPLTTQAPAGPTGAGAAVRVVGVVRAAGTVRAACPGDLDTVWGFLEESCRAGRVRPPWLMSRVADPWRIVDMSRAEVTRQIESGICLLHRSAPGGAAGEAIDGLALAGVFAQGSPLASDYGWSCVSFLEGQAPVVAALLATAMEVVGAEKTAASLTVSLPASQWETLLSIAKPGWPKGPALDGVIYEKDLGEDLTRGLRPCLGTRGCGP